MASGTGESRSSPRTNAASEAIVSVTREASSIDADALVVEEAIVADVGANSSVEFLTVGTLGTGDAALSGGVDGEPSEAGSACVNSTRALGAVRAAGHTDAVDCCGSALATNHAISIGNDA